MKVPLTINDFLDRGVNVFPDRVAIVDENFRRRVAAGDLPEGRAPTPGLSATGAVGVFRSPALMNLAMRQSWVALGVSIAAMIGSGMLVRSIPYENTVPKHAAWLLHTGVMGLMVAPLCLMGGAVLTRAAWYTAGMVGGLSTGTKLRFGEKPLACVTLFFYETYFLSNVFPYFRKASVVF